MIDKAKSGSVSLGGEYFERIAVYMIFAFCALVSIILWILNWVCWYRECCCFRACDDYSNKVFSWWLSFICFCGIIGCCIAGFVTANRLGFTSYAIQCAYERVYYDTINGQLKSDYPRWDGTGKTKTYLSGLVSIYSDVKVTFSDSIFYLKNKTGLCDKDFIYPVHQNFAKKICEGDLENADDILKEVNKKLFTGVSSLYNLYTIKNLIENKDGLSDNGYSDDLTEIDQGMATFKENFISDFEYYVHVARGMGQIVPIIYLVFLLITALIALAALIIYYCNCFRIFNQIDYIFPMHIIWNVTRFFVFSFFMYGMGFGMSFIVVRDVIPYLQYVFGKENVGTGSTTIVIPEKTKKYFNYCLFSEDVIFDDVLDQSNIDEFISNMIKFEEWKNIDVTIDNSAIIDLFNEYKAALIGAYTVNNANSYSSYKEIYKKTGSVYSSLNCTFIQYDLNVMYEALWDFSWEARILCTLSCFIGFLGALGVYGFLWSMYLWRKSDNSGFRFVVNNQVEGYKPPMPPIQTKNNLYSVPKHLPKVRKLKKPAIPPPKYSNDNYNEYNDINNNYNNNIEMSNEMQQQNNNDDYD